MQYDLGQETKHVSFRSARQRVSPSHGWGPRLAARSGPLCGHLYPLSACSYPLIPDSSLRGGLDTKELMESHGGPCVLEAMSTVPPPEGPLGGLFLPGPEHPAPPLSTLSELSHNPAPSSASTVLSVLMHVVLASISWFFYTLVPIIGHEILRCPRWVT